MLTPAMLTGLRAIEAGEVRWTTWGLDSPIGGATLKALAHRGLAERDLAARRWYLTEAARAILAELDG